LKIIEVMKMITLKHVLKMIEAASRDKCFCYVLGVLVGDGNVSFLHKRRTCGVIELNTTDKDFATIFYYAVRKWTGKAPKFYRSFRRVFGRYYSYYDVRLNDTSLVRFLLRIGKYHTRDWIIPEIVRESPSAFLKGFFDSEGDVTLYLKHSSYRYPCVRASSVNKEGILQIQQLLQNLKITSSLFEEHLKRPKGYTFYRIRIKGVKPILRFCEKVGFLLPSKINKLHNLMNQLGIPQPYFSF